MPARLETKSEDFENIFLTVERALQTASRTPRDLHGGLEHANGELRFIARLNVANRAACNHYARAQMRRESSRANARQLCQRFLRRELARMDGSSGFRGLKAMAAVAR
jgi:hypothetical protein